MKYFKIMDDYYAEVCIDGYVLRKKKVSEDGYESYVVVNTFPSMKSLVERVARYKVIGLLDKGSIDTLGEFIYEEDRIKQRLIDDLLPYSKI
jgi:hypothetical protein